MKKLRCGNQLLLVIVLLSGSRPLNAQEQQDNNPKGDIKVRVTSNEGAFLRAKIFVVGSHGPPRRYDDTNGEFQIPLLDPGSYTIVACDGPDFLPGSESFDLSSREPSEPVTIVLYKPVLNDAKGKVTVQVRDTNKHPVSGAQVTLTVGISHQNFDCRSILPGFSNDQGSYAIQEIPPIKQMPSLLPTFSVKASYKNLFSEAKSFSPEGRDEYVELKLEGESSQSAGIIGGTAPTPSVTGGAGNSYRLHVSNVIAIEATYTRRIIATRRLQLNVEFPFVIRPSAKVSSDNVAVARDYRALFFTPSARLTFLVHRRIYPWVSLGSGLAHFVPSSFTQQVTANGEFATSGASSTNKVAFQGGSGVDFWPLHHFGLRTQVRNFYSGRPDLGVRDINLRNNLFVGGGLLIR